MKSVEESAWKLKRMQKITCTKFAINHIDEHAKTRTLDDIPGFTEAFSSMNKAQTDLLKELYSKVIYFREENKDLAALTKKGNKGKKLVM